MKARNFRYVRACSLAHAHELLAQGGPDAVPLAGGQSLLAGLNLRLSAPKLLVDIGELDELRGEAREDGALRLGALTRHADLLRSELIREHVPLLPQAARFIGHIGIRNRGTLGGSLAYADPAAELPACSVALDATLVLSSLAGQRQVKAEDFFLGLFETALRPGELVSAVKFPIAAQSARYGFAELARRIGDFAMAGVAAVAQLQDSRVATARLVYFGCADRAKVAATVSQSLSGVRLPLADFKAFEEAIHHDLKPEDTPGLRGNTKLQMAKALTRRVVNDLQRSAAR